MANGRIPAPPTRGLPPIEVPIIGARPRGLLVYEPQDDITLAELAKLMPFIVASALGQSVSGAMLQSLGDATRHFKVVDPNAQPRS